MIGGEDHIRISAIESGSDFETLYKKIDEVDNALSEILPIAFDEVLGYLTECPTELGTGMKASVLLHLPALKIQDEISSISDSVSKIGLAITPFDSGENTSSIYQISNNVTMGISEKTAIENLRAVTSQIVARENNARYSLDRITLEESINIALNGLKNSDKLDFDSAIDLLSKVKLGIDLGIIEGISHHLPFMLMINTKPNTLKLSLKDVKKDINIIRAEYIKRYLN